jgi:hypothetical protein
MDSDATDRGSAVIQWGCEHRRRTTLMRCLVKTVTEQRLEKTTTDWDSVCCIILLSVQTSGTLIILCSYKLEVFNKSNCQTKNHIQSLTPDNMIWTSAKKNNVYMPQLAITVLSFGWRIHTAMTIFAHDLLNNIWTASEHGYEGYTPLTLYPNWIWVNWR